nr:hypothetical protein [Rhizobium leguminosarum]
MVELYDTPEEAATACEHMTGRKLRRGYRYAGATYSAQEIVTPQGAKTASADFVRPATPAEESPIRTICAQRALEFPESTSEQPHCLKER